MTRILTDGHPTLYTFSENPTVKIAEKTVTPFGIDMGGENDVTTMRNTEWRTRMPKHLKTLTESGVTCAYDPAVIPQMEAMAGVNQLITITFPDGDEVDFWGWIDKFIPGEHSEGEQPTADLTIIPSNLDDSEAEVGPVYRAFVEEGAAPMEPQEFDAEPMDEEVVVHAAAPRPKRVTRKAPRQKPRSTRSPAV